MQQKHLLDPRCLSGNPESLVRALLDKNPLRQLQSHRFFCTKSQLYTWHNPCYLWILATAGYLSSNAKSLERALLDMDPLWCCCLESSCDQPAICD